MRAYTVHAPPRDPEPERFAFVKDGFSWPAFFIPILWTLWHRMWLVLLGYIVFVLLIALIGELSGDGYAAILGIGGALLLGLEGNNIRRWSLARRGWRDIGESAGDTLAEAEIRFFGGWEALAPHVHGALLAGDTDADAETVSTSDEPILGLFPEPETSRIS